ncbi:MAG TPA: flagellar hook protein FlgE [Arthrobacter sp.]
MLRSLYSGISGLKAHQTMLDVTANNIANVNTAGFKSSATQFQDTLSQMTKGAAAGGGAAGGTNPAQIGLGTTVAGISTNFTQGSAQTTGKATDMMISGDGFFVTSKGGESLYTRAGSFNQDAQGRLVSSDGAILQGWTAVNGVLAAGGPTNDIVLSSQIVSPAKATTTAKAGGNLPSEAPVGTTLIRDIKIYDATGTPGALTVTFTRTATGWTADAPGSTGPADLTFTDGKVDGTPALTAGGIAVDLKGLTGYANMNSVAVTSQDGYSAGTLESFSLSPDGTLVGSFSNGMKTDVARVALASFANPGGLEKNGSSGYVATANSGAAVLGAAGSPGLGSLSAGTLEMSNVDLSQEFTNLIVAQRGFQANSRIITTSDSVLEEIVSLKR